MGSATTAVSSGLPPAPHCTLSIPRVERRLARSMSPHMPAPRSTASTCSRSPRIASRRSIRGPAACSPPSRRPAAVATRGLAWAEGTLWVGQYRERKIHQVDPDTGAVLRSIESNRFVTGVSWVDGELWHGTWEGDESELRHVDPQTGEVLEVLEMPPGMGVSGLASDGGDRLLCGGGNSGRLRAVQCPQADAAPAGGSTSGTGARD
jgi:hypothetical protein